MHPESNSIRGVTLKKRYARDVNLTLAYSSLEAFSGLKFGAAFRRINSLRIARHGCEALAAITPPDVEMGVDDASAAMHPAVLDAAFQAMAFLHGLDSDMFVPNQPRIQKKAAFLTF